MSWKTARDQLAHILENDLSGLAQGNGLNGALVEDRDGGWDSPLAAGRFRIRCSASAFNAASSYGEPRYFKDVEIKRSYGGTWGDQARLDEVIWDDEDAIVRGLRDVTNWDQGTSLIISMSAGGAEMLPADREDGEQATLVVTRIALEHY